MLSMGLYGLGDFMLKKKVNGSWADTSMLKKQDNGVWSYISSLKKKINGAWSDVFFNWFSIIEYEITGRCVGRVQTQSNGSARIYNHLGAPYDSTAIVSGRFGKFNAVAGDTISVHYDYDIYDDSTGGTTRAHAAITNHGFIYQELFSDTNRALYSGHTTGSDTVTYTFTQNYNNVCIYVEIRQGHTSDSMGYNETDITLSNIYINGAKVYFDNITYGN